MEILRLAALILALASACAALASLGGAFSRRLDVLSHFTPLYWAGGAVAIAVALIAGPGNAVANAAGLIALGVTSANMAPEFAARFAYRPVAPVGRPLRMVQFNLWHINRDPGATTRWILSQAPDIAVVEEATRANAPLLAALESALPYRSRCVHPGHCSTRILSRLPIADSADLADIDPGDFSGAWARIDDGGEGFVVVALHLTWPLPSRQHHRQSKEAAKRLAQFDRSSLIVAGDFNCTPWSFALRRQDARFGIPRLSRALFTWPVQRTRWGISLPLPILPIDHVYAGPGWRCIGVRAGPRLGSDHRPVVVELVRAIERGRSLASA